MIFSVFLGGTFIDLMASCHICQSSLRLKLTPKNYQKWSALILDHLREHQDVIPYLCLKILPPHPNWENYLHHLIHFMYQSMSRESFAPLLMDSFAQDVLMALWEAHGD